MIAHRNFLPAGRASSGSHLRPLRRILAALLLLAAAAPGWAAGPATLHKGKLLVCFYPNFQPFIGKDAKGAWSGWDYDYLQAFAQQQGLQLVVVESPEFDGIWNQPGAGDCDIAGSGISDLPERRKATGTALTWSATYYSVLRSYAVRQENRLEKLEDLAGKTVIVTKNSTADLDLANRIQCAKPSPKMEIERTNDEAAGAQAVTNGKAFAYGGGLGSIQDLVAVPGSNLKVAWTHCFMTADCRETSEPFSFVVRTASTGLAAALDAYIGAGKGGAWDYQGNVEKREHGGDPIDCPK